MFFPVYDVNFKRGSSEETIVATGDIRNDSNKDYACALFKIVIYSKHSAIGSGVIKIHDFKLKTTKSFNVLIDAHSKLIPAIMRYEILMERGY